jgi:hypothetical protein
MAKAISMALTVLRTLAALSGLAPSAVRAKRSGGSRLREDLNQKYRLERGLGRL